MDYKSNHVRKWVEEVELSHLFYSDLGPLNLKSDEDDKSDMRTLGLSLDEAELKDDADQLMALRNSCGLW